uniref:Single stranded DNA-binding protein n=1 Tax=Geladintestivirus 3 TaxID=3233135 RepID=A0AAU8MHI6_9CAUD
MTEVKGNAEVGAQTTATRKVNRRGVSNSTQAVTRLKFHEKDAAQNGLFIAHLDSVSVEWSQNAEGNSFAGLKMPRLVITFASNHADKKERRYAVKTLFPVESNVDTIPGGKSAWMVDSILNFTKHLLDVFYLRGREMTIEEEDALTLDFEDFTEDENGNVEYKSVDPQDVLNGYRKLFDNVAAMMNGSFKALADGETPKPCFKDANGKSITCWIKLLRCVRTKKGWVDVDKSKDLVFPSFVGNGIIELVKTKDGQVLPPVILNIDKVKESITPKQTANDTAKAPSIGVPGMPGAGIGAAVVPPMGGGVGATAMPGLDPTESDDLPF